jgi:hypothetical protein
VLREAPPGGAAVTSYVVFTTTCAGYLSAVSAAIGAILRKVPLAAGGGHE